MMFLYMVIYITYSKYYNTIVNILQKQQFLQGKQQKTATKIVAVMQGLRFYALALSAFVVVEQSTLQLTELCPRPNQAGQANQCCTRH